MADIGACGKYIVGVLLLVSGTLKMQAIIHYITEYDE